MSRALTLPHSRALTGALTFATLAEVYGVMPVIPCMERGATDGRFLRNAGQQVLGIIGLFVER